MAEPTTARGTKRGERLPPPPAPPPAPASDPAPAPARGRPAIKCNGLSTDKDQRSRIHTLVTDLELQLVEANADKDAGTIAGQTLIAGLSARVWSLRSLAVTDIFARARCDQAADMARTQLCRLEKAQHAARAKRLVEVVEGQQAAREKLGALKKRGG